MRRSLLSAVLSLSVLLSTLVMAQDASYTFTTIDVPGANATQVLGINASGQTVGYYVDASGLHGFMQSGDRYTTIDIPGHAFTVPYGINTAGQIVGYYADSVYPGLINHGFLLSGGNLTIIDVPGSISTSVYGVNDQVQIVGAYQDAQGLEHGFVLTDGHYTTIDVPGSIDTQATGINNAGHIVGTHQFGDGLVHSFLLVDGNLTAIDAPGSRYTVARGINDTGAIVGEFIDGAGHHGFLLRDGHYTTIDVPDSGFTNAYGINGSGQIVGAYTDLDPGRTHGFVATPVKVDMSPPVVTVSASPATLWPPNGRLVAVAVSGAITDGGNGSGVQASTYQVTDEYGQIQPSGSLTLVNGEYAFSVALPASRRGNDKDGRRYTITVSATDQAGNRGDALTLVTVPHG